MFCFAALLTYVQLLRAYRGQPENINQSFEVNRHWCIYVELDLTMLSIKHHFH